MTIQDACEVCLVLCDADSLIYIEYKKQHMCSVCINELVWGLVISNSHLKTRLNQGN